MVRKDLQFRIFELLAETNSGQIYLLQRCWDRISVADFIDTITDLHGNEQISLFSATGRKKHSISEMKFSDYIGYFNND